MRELQFTELTVVAGRNRTQKILTELLQDMSGSRLT